ncbi:aldehyde dehydrogenase family protein [Nocardioides aquiterrae]|uniref:Aldehyde dehydrogenase (NADP(+)) n=1 Tax=Nocardioides aquiterrae TaxID=203799 RepID=A0ABN1UNT3_9ACTN
MSVVSYDPVTGRENGRLEESTPAEVLAAVERAVEVAEEVAGTAPAVRRAWLAAVADALEAEADDLIALGDSETGLGRPRLEAELARTAGQLRFYGDVAAEGSYLGVTIDHAREAQPFLARVQVPLGPVAVFGASNFPFAFSVLGNDTASAVAAGCPVVVKAHPAHPLLSQALGRIARSALDAAGAPAGLFALVSGRQAGIDLVQAPGIAAVAFTGSQAGGLALWRLANERERVVPVFAEMGTVNPVVVTPGAMSRMAEIAAGFVGSFTLGSGQYCTKPGLMFAPAGSGALDAVAAALRDAAPRPVMLTADIAAAVRTGLEALVAAGAEVAGVVEAGADGWAAPAAVLGAPLREIRPGSRLLEECFGAVALVVEYADERELAAAVGRLQGSLAGSVFTADGPDEAAGRAMGMLSSRVGRVTVNDWPTGVAYSWAQQHGGPWPATSAPAATSVGAAALDRFVRPVAYQSARDEWLPPVARSDNPWSVPRRVDGVLQTAP